MAKTTKYSGTQTEKNLEAAFAGESQARNKYTPVINRVTYSRPPAYKYRLLFQKLSLPFYFTSKNLFILSVDFHAYDL